MVLIDFTRMFKCTSYGTFNHLSPNIPLKIFRFKHLSNISFYLMSGRYRTMLI